jgi:hypothetical protein
VSIDDLRLATQACLAFAEARAQEAAASSSPSHSLELTRVQREFERLAEVFSSAADNALGSGIPLPTD